jgi:hypothetical protein
MRDTIEIWVRARGALEGFCSYICSTPLCYASIAHAMGVGESHYNCNASRTRAPCNMPRLWPTSLSAKLSLAARKYPKRYGRSVKVPGRGSFSMLLKAQASRGPGHIGPMKTTRLPLRLTRGIARRCSMQPLGPTSSSGAWMIRNGCQGVLAKVWSYLSCTRLNPWSVLPACQAVLC